MRSGGYAGTMNNESKNYHAYLLRIWPEAPGRGLPDGWRASLEDARTGERLGFSCLEHLFAYLLQLAEQSEADGTAGNQP